MTNTSLREAALSSGRCLQSRGDRISLCVSGGQDSLSMLEIFNEIGLPFHVYSLRFANQMNAYDLSSVIDYCSTHSIHHRLIDLNLDHFYGQGIHDDYALKYHCTSPQFTTHLWMLDQIDGVPILSGNPLQVVMRKPRRWNLPIYNEFCIQRYLDLNNRSGCDFFWMSSFELLALFSRVPLNQYLLQLDSTCFISDDPIYIKYCLYELVGISPNFSKKKRTGFELYKKTLEERYNEPGFFDNHYRIPYQKKIGIPREEIILPKELSLEKT